MKKRIFIIIAALFAIVAHAAAQSNERELTREEKKALQQTIDSIQNAEAVRAVMDTAFTLEANQVLFKYGQRAYVSSHTNFVAIKKDRATIQLSFNIPAAGANGMGGITLDGIISKYKVTTDKKGTVRAEMNVMGNALSAQLYITLYKYNNEATIDVLPDFSSRRMTFMGVILPPDDSFVVKGRSL